MCSVRTRPNRSASAPANQPPNADVSNVTVPIRPASALVIAKAMIIAGITKENICTSIASSAQPPKQAQKVRCSTGVSSRYQLIALAAACVITVVIASPVAARVARATADWTNGQDATRGHVDARARRTFSSYSHAILPRPARTRLPRGAEPGASNAGAISRREGFPILPFRGQAPGPLSPLLTSPVRQTNFHCYHDSYTAQTRDTQ